MHRTEREFQIGDWVYLRLQPYKQQSVAYRASHKLSPRFFGPFKIIQRVGPVAYRLDLPASSCIHPVFHVSCLKAKLGHNSVPLPSLPSVTSQGVLAPKPVAILQTRTLQLRRRTITQLLVQWQGCSSDDATWEDRLTLQQQFPHLEGNLF